MAYFNTRKIMLVGLKGEKGDPGISDALYQHDINIHHPTYNGITGYDGPGCDLYLRVYNRNPNKMLSFDEIKPHARYFVSASIHADDVSEECIFMGAAMFGDVLSVKVANAATDGLQHISTQTFNFNWNALNVSDNVTEV